MPLTFAHPAAAIPLARLLGRHGSVSALALGSMTPDLPFFLGASMARSDTHSLPALLTWALPAGLLLYLLFQGLLKQALTALAPAPVQTRLATEHAAPPPGLATIAVSLLCGAATHLLWDAFTHPGTVIVDGIPLLQASVGSVGSYQVYVYKILQHAGTVAGLSLLACWSWRWYGRTAPGMPARPAMAAPLRRGICATLIALPLAAGAWAAWPHGQSTARLASFVFTTLPVFFWMLTAYALLWHLACGRRGRT
ncbi:DUF4184 family protein [Massilia sp. PAMC28688]|uniref:DUF4184 family protein n=1 Tax=Massilia sp. PAMC28688 TaxID=2861283 RepID=UPI001C625A90|nr:DUF4184 family protein [Massilia sp. PAMC28688]QYF94026.1 DUF4184 family protein [Massilia sp. PAMC28688]